MFPKRMLLSLTLLFGLAACSSHEQSSSVIPQSISPSRSSAVNPATACAIVPSTIGNFPGIVGGASVSDAWAIASVVVNSAFQFEHFTSDGWHSVPPPVTPSFAVIQLRQLAAIAPNNVWTGGVGTDQFGNNRTAFFLHWDGHGWTYVPSDPSLTHGFEIETVAGDAANNVWAIASSQPGNVPTEQLERWDGARWSFVTTLHGENGFIGVGSLIQVFGRNDVWMMLPTPVNIVIAHWNGTAVSTTGVPPLGGAPPKGGAGFAGTSGDDLWLDSVNVRVIPYIAHRSSSWALYNTSLVAGYGVDAIVDFKPGYVLMTAFTPSGIPALLVYNGYVRWRPTTSPWPIGTNDLGDATPVKGTTSFWASYTVAPSLPNAALVTCPSTPPTPL